MVRIIFTITRLAPGTCVASLPPKSHDARCPPPFPKGHFPIFFWRRNLKIEAQQSFWRSIAQARQKSTKINLLGPETARWGGGLPREGVVVEKFAPSLESLSSFSFEGRNLGDVPDPWGCSKSLCTKKVCAHFSFPMLGCRKFFLWHLNWDSDCLVQGPNSCFFLEQETILGLSGPRPKGLLAPSLIDSLGKSRNSGLVPGNQNPNI